MDARTIRVDELREASIDDQTLVLDRSNAQCHVLNASSSVMWSFMGTTSTIGDIIDTLMQETGLDRSAVSAFVTTAVRGFTDAGLVDIVDPMESTPSDVGSGSLIEPSEEEREEERRAAEHAARRPARIARRREWIAVAKRILDRMPELTVHGPWQFGDVRTTVATDRPEVGTYLDRLLVAMEVEDGAPALGEIVRFHILSRPRGTDRVSAHRDGHVRLRHSTSAEAIDLVLRDLNLLASDRTTDAVMLHAGAVEFDGRVLVVTGESGRGKSTLTAALVLAGGRYLTDELVIIDPTDHSVRPYAKPIDLGPGSLELLGLPAEDGYVADKRHVPPDELGDLSAGGRLAGVVILGSGSGAMEQVDPVTGVTMLLPNVFAATHRNPGSMESLANIATTVPILVAAARGPHESSTPTPRPTPQAAAAMVRDHFLTTET